MAKRRRRGRHLAQPEGVLGSALRPVAWSALLGAATAAALAAPAYADPIGSTTIPDVGSRPVPVGALPMPGGGSFTAPIGRSPTNTLAAEITAAEVEVSTLGEQLKQLGIERVGLRDAVTLTDYQWRRATDLLRVAQERADEAAHEAFMDAAGLPPGLNELSGLGALPGVRGDSSVMSEARDVARASESERAAYQAYQAAITAEQSAASRYTALEATYKQREAALLELKRRHASELAVVERELEAREQALGASYVGGDIAGLQAHPQALAAVQFALRQLGKPYLWSAEGPDRYDCSGLMWAAYRSTGYTLPRVSVDQYYATRGKSVSRYALLPGDLLFFSSTGEWTGIHHVGMYIGNGKMIHAPTTGDVVKISTVWWSRFFAATRVYGAVPSPGPSTPGPLPTTSAPGPLPTTPGPRPTTPSPTPSTPSPTPSTPSPTPSTPSPSPTSPSPDPTSPSPDPTSPSPDPTSPSPEATTAAPEATTAAPSESTTTAPAADPTVESTQPTDTSSASAPADTTPTSGS
jgi:cell wall-associated NlpC family hydrolase